MKLYELPDRQNPRPKIYGLNPNGHKNGWVEFDHIDGMYSYCVAFDGLGNRLGPVHLKAWTPLEPFEDGYRVVEE
ncbi:hypothetical protein [Mycobacteroides abscessus]|uniref:hypothetical protein n=1 Tax=Mycobacteroides abscessus TaxID=36809 RepID=UPI000C2630FD|nr:hypothetical protein [Mycobacteroides abscessus]PVB24450.1 hypothetical protein DDJ71_06275 [Mycobacteroides abscessus]